MCDYPGVARQGDEFYVPFKERSCPRYFFYSRGRDRLGVGMRGGTRQREAMNFARDNDGVVLLKQQGGKASRTEYRFEDALS